MLYSCNEVPVTIPTYTEPPATTYPQRVLIEEYTGVRCQNCPAGAQALEELKSIHGDRLVVLSIHGGFFAQPTNLENKLKLDNADGAELIKIFNEPLGYPSAMINRMVFNGQSSRFLGSTSWAGYIDQEKNKTPSIGMDLEIQIDTILKKLNVQAEVIALTEPASDPLYLSIVLVETNIKDAQLGPTGVDTNYIHRHVMRAFVTGVQGNKINALTLNNKQEYNFSANYNPTWKRNDLSVIAFVHHGSPGYGVIQVIEKKVN